ncbi:MAG TPA: hypothetical protein VGD40_16230 [Chryseosolibacter sp.]
MPRFRSLSIVLLLSTLFHSCSNDLPTLNGIDIQQWKEDKNGCEGKRFPMASHLKIEKDKLLTLNEKEIIKVLGRPDRNELFKRNQKFYYYFLQPAPECNLGNDNAQKLVVRFNAMGLAKEVVIE